MKQQRFVIIPTATTTRELYKDVVFSDAGPVWEADGMEKVCYEVSIDYAAVEEMARRATANDGQVSRAGPLRVRVLSRARY